MAFGESGCVIIGEGRYRKKCNYCGYVQSHVKSTFSKNNKTRMFKGSFKCLKCGKTSKVIIDGRKYL